MNEFQELLKVIRDGKKSFQPDGGSLSDMEAFQHVVKMLLHADELSYLDGLRTMKESWSGNRWYNNAVVLNGLTYQGELAASADSKDKEILQLKPEFYGVSVDVKEAIRRLVLKFSSGDGK